MQFSHFPKKKLKTLKEIKIVSIDIDLFCSCSVPDVKGLGPWIACDVCDQWYLQKCEGISGKKYQGGSCTHARIVKPNLPQGY